MKIVLNEITKKAELIKSDGTIISTYSYKNMTHPTFKADIDKFNKELESVDDFDDIKDLSRIVNLHDFS